MPDKEIVAKKGYKLTPANLRFIKAYADFRSPTCGNGSKSYLVAYPNGTINSARQSACTLLKKEAIQNALSDEMEVNGFNDIIVDRALLRTIRQNKELSPKVQAIKEYNRLRKRIDNQESNTNINIGFSLTQLFEEANNVKEQKSKRDVIDFDLNAMD